MIEKLPSIVLFAIVASVTPGPNNIMVLASGVNFGIRRSLPLLAGICIGFPVMLLVVGLGFGRIFEVYPQLHLLIKVVGIAYLLYLAWLIANTPTTASPMQSIASAGAPIGFVRGALFQWVNAKAWIVASGAVAAFTTLDGSVMSETALVALAFLSVSFPCVGIWLVFGSVLRKTLDSSGRLSWFNRSMALLLVLSVAPVILELVQWAFT